jgi:hypothetical protein
LLYDFDSFRSVEVVKFVRVTHDEIDRAAFGTWRPSLKKDLHLTEIHTCQTRGITLGESRPETEFCRVELDGGPNVADREDRVVLLAFNGRGLCGSPSFVHDSGVMQ